MNKTLAKKYYLQINKNKKKYLTSENLSKIMGVYPEIINEHLCYFEPILTMDPTFNLKELLPLIEEYIEEAEKLTSNKKERTNITKRKLNEFESINDFLYQKLTVGGIVDRHLILSDTDLKILKKLINEEQASRKK